MFSFKFHEKLSIYSYYYDVGNLKYDTKTNYETIIGFPIHEMYPIDVGNNMSIS